MRRTDIPAIEAGHTINYLRNYHGGFMSDLSVDGLDKFTRAYIECALWSSTDEDGEPMDEAYSIDDLSPETFRDMILECDEFQKANSAHLETAYEWGDGHSGYGKAMAGHDFWLTRNRHGAGFWDRGLPKSTATALTNAAHSEGSRDLDAGDDDLLHQS